MQFNKNTITTILLIAAIGYIAYMHLHKSKSSDSKYTQEMAFTESRIYTSENLKSKDLKFGNTVIAPVNDSTYLVQGDVDLVDETGKLIGISYACKIAFSNDSVYRSHMVMDARK